MHPRYDTISEITVVGEEVDSILKMPRDGGYAIRTLPYVTGMIRNTLKTCCLFRMIFYVFKKKIVNNFVQYKPKTNLPTYAWLVGITKSTEHLIIITVWSQ